MTSITNSLSSYSNGFNLAAIKTKAHKLSSRFISQHTRPYESTIQMIARKAFEALAACLVVATGLIALLPLSLGFALYRAFQPGTYYFIESPSGNLTKAEILAQLRYLKASEREFETLEFRQQASAPRLELDGDVLELLKELHPAQLILPSTTNSELADNLETVTYYYTQRAYCANPGISQCCLERKEKIKHLVLPGDPEEMVEKLRKLTDAKERVTNIYYTRVLPQNFETSVKELVVQLRPSLELLIDNKNKLSSLALEAQLAL